MSNKLLAIAWDVHSHFTGKIPLIYGLSSANAGSTSGSCSTSVAVTAVVSCAVSLIIGALVGAVVHYCAVRKKSKCHKFYSLTLAHKQQKQQPAPVYEDIVAQKGTVDTTHIELRENIAYGPVQNWLNLYACTYMDNHVCGFSSIFMNSPHISPSFLISVRGKGTTYGMHAYLQTVAYHFGHAS